MMSPVSTSTTIAADSAPLTPRSRISRSPLGLNSTGLYPGATTRVIGPEPSSRHRETTGWFAAEADELPTATSRPQHSAAPVLGVESAQHQPRCEVALLEPAEDVAAVEPVACGDDGEMKAHLVLVVLPEDSAAGEVDACKSFAPGGDDRAVAGVTEV